MYQRPEFETLLSRLQEPRRFIQVLAGPRQAGKTTLAQQVITSLNIPSHFASADEPSLQGHIWIEQQWEIVRLLIKERRTPVLLVLDEIQKLSSWSMVVKKLWDEDTASGLSLKVLLLGSSPLLIQKGLTESLAGRFELIPVTHWSFPEMQQAFGWSLDQFIYFGGYPGAATLIEDEARWTRYILDSLVETTISRDVLLMSQVNKPVLLRRLFQLCCEYSGQILSYQKMLGQLQDSGNTTTLAHYLELLSGAGMVTGIFKYAGETVRQKGSSPKLQVLNTALMSTQLKMNFNHARKNNEIWGRLVESAIGAYLLNNAHKENIEVFYWRDRNREVDFILRHGTKLVALEVKSALRKTSLPGVAAFSDIFKPTRVLLVGGQGIALQDFLSRPVGHWVE